MTRPMGHSDPRRVRNSRACSYCRECKGKCDGEPPESKSSIAANPCSRCLAANRVCEWVPSRRKGRTKRADVEINASNSDELSTPPSTRSVDKNPYLNLPFYKLFPSVFTVFDDVQDTAESSSPSSEEPSIDLPLLSDIFDLIRFQSIGERIPPLLSHQNNLLGPSDEVLQLINTFYFRVNQMVPVLPSRHIFLSRHLATSSPFLLSSICALAQPFHKHTHTFSTDYFSLAQSLSSDQDIPPFEKFIAHLFMCHAAYGHAYSYSAVEHLRHAMKAITDHNVFGGSTSILITDTVPFSEIILKKAIIQLSNTNLSSQFTLNASGPVIDCQDVAVWFKSCKTDDFDPALLFLFKVAEFMNVVSSLSTKSPDADIHKAAQFDALNKLLQTLIATNEERWFKQLLLRKKIKSEDESWLVDKEIYYYLGHVLYSFQIHITRYFKFPELSLNFKICHLEPDGSSYDVVDDMHRLQLSSSSSTPPIQPREMPSVKPVPFAAIQLIVNTAESSLNLIRDSNRLFRTQFSDNQAPTSINRSTRDVDDTEQGEDDIHSPFLLCCQIAQCFALQLAVVALCQVVEANSDALRDEELKHSIQWKLRSFIGELDYLEDYIATQGKVWTVAHIKLRRLKDCRAGIFHYFKNAIATLDL